MPQTASAASGSFDIYSIKADDLHVNSGNCRNINVTARSGAGDESSIQSVDASVDVWLGNKNVGSVELSSKGVDTTYLSGSYFYCPYFDTVGTFRLGPSAVTYTDFDYNDYNFVDNTTGTMRALRATSLKNFSVKKAGRKRTFKVKGTYFAISDSARLSMPKGTKLALQRRASNGKGAWKQVKSARVKSKGTATFVTKPKKRYQYRVASASTRYSWNATTRTLTK